MLSVLNSYRNTNPEVKDLYLNFCRFKNFASKYKILNFPSVFGKHFSRASDLFGVIFSVSYINPSYRRKNHHNHWRILISPFSIICILLLDPLLICDRSLELRSLTAHEKNTLPHKDHHSISTVYAREDFDLHTIQHDSKHFNWTVNNEREFFSPWTSCFSRTLPEYTSSPDDCVSLSSLCLGVCNPGLVDIRGPDGHVCMSLALNTRLALSSNHVGSSTKVSRAPPLRTTELKPSSSHTALKPISEHMNVLNVNTVHSLPSTKVRREALDLPLPTMVKQILSNRVTADFPLSPLLVKGCPLGKVSCKLTASYPVWERELKYDVDRKYILNGVLEGFDILEGHLPSFRANMENYKSASVFNRSKVESQIACEISEGNYCLVDSEPAVVSSIGAIPKDNGKVRLIHDLSRPNGGMNSFLTDTSCSFKTLDMATSMMNPGCFLAKVDLRSAYRSVPIHPSNYTYMGLSWTFQKGGQKSYMIDAKLPFGSGKACQIFQCLSNSVSRMLAKRGVQTINYLDDILIVSSSKSKCWLDLDFTINLLTQLGFDINWSKVEPPTQHITFLGIYVDSISRKLALPHKKWVALIELLHKWKFKKRCSKLDLQKLLGHLNWASKVIRGGRTFLRRLIDLCMKLKSGHHRTWLSREARADIHWWLQGVSVFHGSCPFSCDLRPPDQELATDSCLVGGGAFYGNDWLYSNFSQDFPDLLGEHINTLELVTVLLSVRRWGHLWRGRHICVRCDNSSTVAAINKGTSRSKIFMKYLRELFWLSEVNGFRLTAKHIKGEHNFLADLISRLHDPVCASKFLYICSPVNSYLNCYKNMSYKSFLSLPL